MTVLPGSRRIQIWQSFSCNNSSSFRLIARFADHAAAASAATALRDTFEALAIEVGGHGRRGDAPTVMEALAQRYGLAWQDDGWYDDGDGPFVFADAELVIAHHEYCLGLGPGIPRFLAEHGGEVAPETYENLQVSLLFRSTPGADPLLDAELVILFAQLVEGRRSGDAEPMVVPWTDKATARGSVAMFRDAATVGIAFPLVPRDLAALRAWLVKRGIVDPVLRIDEPADEELFAMLFGARCTACGGELAYLDPRLHDIETAQLMCTPCGGLYELEAFARRHP